MELFSFVVVALEVELEEMAIILFILLFSLLITIDGVTAIVVVVEEFLL